MKNQYMVYYNYIMSGAVSIKANSEEEAMMIAENDMDLPQGEYLKGSLDVTDADLEIENVMEK